MFYQNFQLIYKLKNETFRYLLVSNIVETVETA